MQGFAGGYSAKVPTIANYTTLVANKWELAVAENKTIRKWFIKSRSAIDEVNAEFDLTFVDSPTAYLTSDGSGLVYDGCSLPNVYVRTAKAGVVLEINYWD